MVIILLLIALIGMLFFGYWRTKKQGTKVIHDSFAPPERIPYIITDPYRGLSHEKTVFVQPSLTPKEYGIAHGNGASRIKRSNRLKLKK